MFFALRLPNNEIRWVSEFPRPKPELLSEWVAEYPVDNTGTIFRVSPQFKNAGFVVAWLDSAAQMRRAQAESSIPRMTFPDFVGRNPEEFDTSYGTGPTTQYEGLAFKKEQPLAALLVRGQSRVSPLASTLNRCLALH